MIDRTGSFCHYLWSWTRKLSFVSVLLNPAVFALTQKQIFPSIVHVLRKSCNNFCVRACIRKVLRLVEKQQRSESSDSNYGVEMQTLHRREKSKKPGEGRKRFRLMYRVGKKPKPSFISITRKNSKGIPNIETIDEEKSFGNGDHWSSVHGHVTGVSFNTQMDVAEETKAHEQSCRSLQPLVMCCNASKACFYRAGSENSRRLDFVLLFLLCVNYY